MLRVYVSAGFPPGDFWGLTPRLYLAHMRGAEMRFDREHRNDAWLAWHIDGLRRSDKLPDFDQFAKGEAAQVEEGGQTPIRLAVLRASLPKITQEQWRARFEGG